MAIRWSKIFDEMKIDPLRIKNVGDKITKSIFEKLELDPNKWIPVYDEKTRAKRFEGIIDLWPLRTGKGECVLIKGSMNVQSNYSPDKVIFVKNIIMNNSTNLKQINTERLALVEANNIGVFQHLTNNKITHLGVAGKLNLFAEVKYFESIKLDNLQKAI